ncbi:hypothetical protein GCM10010430_55590 [Kitasatospora cystarginea]|uniref:Transposase n=1 Tax=Kitasatospora cystarginea TaxID=58350 RepID=A0ABN3EN93_9ACTN
MFREIKELGYTGSLNLLYRYITQGRAESDRPVISPHRLTCLMLTRPDQLRDKDTDLLKTLTAACPETTELTWLVRSFAELLTPAPGNNAKLTEWITAARAAELPHLQSFCSGVKGGCRNGSRPMVDLTVAEIRRLLATGRPRGPLPPRCSPRAHALNWSTWRRTPGRRPPLPLPTPAAHDRGAVP